MSAETILVTLEINKEIRRVEKLHKARKRKLKNTGLQTVLRPVEHLFLCLQQVSKKGTGAFLHQIFNEKTCSENCPFFKAQSNF